MTPWTAPLRGTRRGQRRTHDAPAGPSTRTLTGVTVLIVEDDALSREALSTILQHHGATVIAAGTVGEALAAYERSFPHVVVSDIGLPDADGYALLRAIRAREFGRGRHILAIAVSAYPVRDTSERARGAGFDAFLAKPIELAALLQALEQPLR